MNARPADAAVIVGAEVSTFVHATEDEGKVERAVLKALPGAVDRTGFRVQRLSGQYNDPILMMTMRIRRKAAAKMFRHVVRSLSALDRQRLIDEAGDRVDGAGNLYLRLDKQSAYLGRAVLHEADPIRVKFRFRVPHGADPVTAVSASLAAVLDEARDLDQVS